MTEESVRLIFELPLRDAFVLKHVADHFDRDYKAQARVMLREALKATAAQLGIEPPQPAATTQSA